MSEQKGFIEVIYGPMFSGKSTELLRKVRRYKHAKKSCLVVNYMFDDRYSEDSCMATHDKQTQEAVKTNDLISLKEKALKYDVIAIDEGQFFTDIVEFADEMANLGTIILVAALDGTFQRKAFNNILNLLPIAQKATKLSAVCVYCSNEAGFTLRTIQSQEVEVIGGEESYKPVCRSCFHKQTHKGEKVGQEVKTANNSPGKVQLELELVQ